jgi:hypothetical protein
VLGTTLTDKEGHYRFDQLTGLSSTGIYSVRLVVPPGFTQASAEPGTILISRGDINVGGVNFVVASAPPNRTDGV